jgi:cbb3-type cytochrome oxidase maturation protein
METLYFLIPIALIFCVITFKLVLWAINSGQYDDLDRDAQIPFEDDFREHIPFEDGFDEQTPQDKETTL